MVPLRNDDGGNRGSGGAGPRTRKRNPEGCAARELREELNLRAAVGPLLDAWIYEPLPGTRVLVLTYGCVVEDFVGMAHSAEHEAVGLFREDELDGIVLPAGYARSVRAWMERVRASRRG